MATIDNNLAQLTVKEFLSEGKYVIPIYQRNYDWGERETLQLLEWSATFDDIDHSNKLIKTPKCSKLVRKA